MKRFLTFRGQNYYPGGGWSDFAGDADSLEEAIKIAKRPHAQNWAIDWWHVIDSETGEEVAEDDHDS